MIKDLKQLAIVFLTALMLAFILNQARARPMPLVYTSPAAALQQASSASSAGAHAGPIRILELAAVRQAVNSGTHLVVDARPGLFWEIGHIPGALSLPRNEFEKRFPDVKALLREAGNQGKPLLLYCADIHCPDAGKLAEALQQHGLGDIAVFEAGWAAWEEAGLPVESK